MTLAVHSLLLWCKNRDCRCLRTASADKRMERTGAWSQIHNEGYHNLYS